MKIKLWIEPQFCGSAPQRGNHGHSFVDTLEEKNKFYPSYYPLSPHQQKKFFTLKKKERREKKKERKKEKKEKEIEKRGI